MEKNKVIFVFFVLLIFFFVGLWGLLGCAPLDACPWEREPEEEDIKKVKLTFYGVFDEKSDWREVFDDFTEYELKKRGIDVSVNYKKIEEDSYVDVLLDNQVNNTSPNIFMMYNSWLPRYKKRIVPMPEDYYMTLSEFKNTYPDIAVNDLVSDGEIYSLPLYIDTLAIYYNKDIFRNAGYLDTPSTWSEFSDYVEDLTIINEDGDIEIAGAAIGGGSRVNRSQDILMLLIMQNNAASGASNISDLSTSEAFKAIDFYIDFANPESKAYTFDYDDKPYSLDQFYLGKTAMHFGYSYEIKNIKAKTGGELNYGIIPVPQQNEANKVNYGSYWTPVVAKNAPCSKEKGVSVTCEELSWDFISFAAKKSNVESYLENTNQPAANLFLSQEQANDKNSLVSAFASQVITAKSWNNTYDDKTDEALMEMIDSIINTDEEEKKSISEAVSIAQKKIVEFN